MTLYIECFVPDCHQLPGFIPLAAINKSVWTCAVEAVAEYCRIVWDIFPNQDRLLRVVVASPECNEVKWHPAERLGKEIPVHHFFLSRCSHFLAGGRKVRQAPL